MTDTDNTIDKPLLELQNMIGFGGKLFKIAFDFVIKRSHVQDKHVHKTSRNPSHNMTPSTKNAREIV